MRPPTNFTASATKKVNPLEAAIANNFAGAHSAESGQGRAVSQITEAKSQILNADSSSTNQAQAVTSQPVAAAQVSVQRESASETTANISSTEPAKAPSRREVKEKFLVSMSKGERSIFKSFCALKGVSMNHFVMCAMDYFKEDLENGKVSISSHSYKRKEG